jgi:hypothetical protein
LAALGRPFSEVGDRRPDAFLQQFVSPDGGVGAGPSTGSLVSGGEFLECRERLDDA